MKFYITCLVLALIIVLTAFCGKAYPQTKPPELIEENIADWIRIQTGNIVVYFKDGTVAMYTVSSTGLCRPTIPGETALTYDGELCYVLPDIPLKVWTPTDAKKLSPF